MTTAPAAKDKNEKDKRKTLPFFEIASLGELYLTVKTGELFQFIHEEDGQLIEQEVMEDGVSPIYPCTLPIHQDTGVRVPIVGVPDGDMMKKVPVLSAPYLYGMLAKHIRKYADLPDLELEIGIYYALYTWFYVKVPTSPYLRYIGDTGKGKSRLLEVVSDLCFYPIKATGASSASGIMRFHEKWKGTLIIDEGDLKGGADDPLIKFLNSGFETGKFLILSDKNDPNQQQIFDPFGPKVLAMREPFKDNATEGRCISFSPYETTRKDIPPELPKTYHDEVAHIRACIARFVLRNWKDVKGEALINFEELDVERRLLQMSRPVSIILQLFPDGKVRFLSYIRQRQKEIRKTRSESWEGSLFNHALMLAQGEDGKIPEAVTPSMLAETFRTSPKAVTSSMRSIGFEIERTNITVVIKEDEKRRRTARKLVIPNEKIWQEITRRYYSPDEKEHQEKIDDVDHIGPSCPDVLKGRKYGILDPEPVTHVTLVTDTVHRPPKENNTVTLVTDTILTGQKFDKELSYTDDAPDGEERGLCTVSVTRVTTVTPSYHGKTRAELTKIREKHLPDQPPDPEAFRSAWQAAGGPTP